MSKATADGGRARRVRKEPDERRDQILRCARELFSKHPYEAVSSAQIADAAGVSRGLLNHYFGTKRGLYLAAVRQMLSVPPPPVPAFVAGATVRDRVAQALDAWLELLERNRGTWITALDMMASGGDRELGRILDEARDRAVARVTEIVGLTPLAAEHPEVLSALRGFAGMAMDTSREWLKYGRLTRAQVHMLLEQTILHLTEHLIPRLVAEADRPAAAEASPSSV
ncbi:MULTISPECIES: TetR/AcrR family transcriptional regulator [Thermomonospora]|mgnify:CR=1 FL=1|uniref:Transcriptional regulator, TetR family n=1 Tax=Thermomonospora curvata (strain ATCC 19995 / DSM 43183 / JCM 3096 / KCTC 9072 / NBRC 15933 / NCIMB 10081 / Henssen B9) TaxID=471852 RepID=D1A3I3_THECD|nr:MULTISPECIES: TetR/AcrR family transcriptional regulator [Thermomonospora]ACY96108.1 transcriptional regulator, TetR family [Thermomonospora curvata DSM 43183]PKK15964.1 MAG: TetR/AcrR family transcriptional regulator [Thermomonospora sp. CIF 1]